MSPQKKLLLRRNAFFRQQLAKPTASDLPPAHQCSKTSNKAADLTENAQLQK
jgi:hypothetical protein